MKEKKPVSVLRFSLSLKKQNYKSIIYQDKYYLTVNYLNVFLYNLGIIVYFNNACFFSFQRFEFSIY